MMANISRNIRVLIVEDDPYARDIMSMLLIRDWRTQVAGEAASLEEIEAMLQDRGGDLIDILLIDSEHPSDPNWAFRIAARAQETRPGIGVLLTATHADAHTLNRVLANHYQGYILNTEVLYTLAWVIVAASAGRWVTTPSIYRLAESLSIKLPSDVAVFDGTQTLDHLRSRERDVARLAILFNLRRADIADELSIGEGQVNKYVSTIYHILGLTDILEGLDTAEEYFADPKILDRFNKARKKALKSKRGSTREKATLAFHLLTTPAREAK